MICMTRTSTRSAALLVSDRFGNTSGPADRCRVVHLAIQRELALCRRARRIGFGNRGLCLANRRFRRARRRLLRRFKPAIGQSDEDLDDRQHNPQQGDDRQDLARKVEVGKASGHGVNGPSACRDRRG